MQEKVAQHQLSIHRIQNKFNLADLMTKYLSKDEIEQIMDFMQHVFMDGRHKDVPELSLVNDSAIPNQQEQDAIKIHVRAERAHSTDIMKNTNLGGVFGC